MRCLELFICFLLAIALTEAAREISQSPNLAKSWREFKLSHGKKYLNSKIEEHRRSVYSQNIRKIVKHNVEALLGLRSFKLGLNKFSDLTAEEFGHLMGFKPLNKTRSKRETLYAYQPDPSLKIPKSIDWRKYSIVSPVQDQGDCGGCWAFSASSAIESHSALATGKLNKLSEQNFIDCVHAPKYQVSEGCNGGNMIEAYQYAIQNGVVKSSLYPYEAVDGPCRFSSKGEDIGANMSLWATVLDEYDMETFVGLEGPLSVSVDATYLQHYSSGVYDSLICSTNVNHAVNIVGYGVTDKGKMYWTVRNSWAADWGEEGYFKLARGKNMCGIAEFVTFPRTCKTGVTTRASTTSSTTMERTLDASRSSSKTLPFIA
ncbi:Cathepsin S [Halotydeus destructor]|nr:Cathepsin S [Halotydeus destructor]